MTATYDGSLQTSRDLVRFLSGDTDTSAAWLQDAEIDVLLAEEQAPAPGAAQFFAAARALEIIKTRWSLRSKGLSSKSIGRLSLSWASGATDVDTRIKELRVKGASLVDPSRAHLLTTL